MRAKAQLKSTTKEATQMGWMGCRIFSLLVLLESLHVSIWGLEDQGIVNKIQEYKNMCFEMKREILPIKYIL